MLSKLCFKEFLDVVSFVLKLLQFISFHDKILNIFFILFFFCINKFFISLEFTLKLINLFNSSLVILLSICNVLLGSLIELSDLLINKFHLFDLSFHIHILILFAFNRQFNVVNHLFELIYCKSNFLILLHYLFAFI